MQNKSVFIFNPEMQPNQETSVSKVTVLPYPFSCFCARCSEISCKKSKKYICIFARLLEPAPPAPTADPQVLTPDFARFFLHRLSTRTCTNPIGGYIFEKRSRPWNISAGPSEESAGPPEKAAGPPQKVEGPPQKVEGPPQICPRPWDVSAEPPQDSVRPPERQILERIQVKGGEFH